MSASEYREFLLSVVNAEDRAESAGTRARFAKLYRGWFPPDFRGEHAANAARVFLKAYSIPHMWKCSDSLQCEKPKTEFSLHVAILRDKLRFIWRTAAAIDFARYELVDLRNSTFQYRNNSRQPDLKEWQRRTLRACDWLEQNLRSLRLCSNPECKQQMYFVKLEKNQRYCCPECSERGQEIGREKRPRAPAKRVLSEKARSAISKAQERRWSRYREEKKGSSKDLDGGSSQ